MRAVVILVGLVLLTACRPEGGAQSPDQPAWPEGVCPPALAAAEGARCHVGDSTATPSRGPKTCDYGEAVCRCASRGRGCRGAPYRPDPRDLFEPVWVCERRRTDGCPDDSPTGPCAEEGKACGGYGGCCPSTAVCTDGVWTLEPGPCPQ